MQRPFIAFALLGLVACSGEAPTTSQPESLLFARGGGQTLYAITFQQGLESDPAHPFSASAKTGDPFSGAVTGDPVYLILPADAGGAAVVCDADGSGLGATSAAWGGYTGVWKGNFSISAKGGEYHFAYRATREDGSGLLWLVINHSAVKSNGNLTLSFTDVRGLVSAYSTPDGGPYDPQDRCLTFSITATP